jgi:hypothetical protein
MVVRTWAGGKREWLAAGQCRTPARGAWHSTPRCSHAVRYLRRDSADRQPALPERHAAGCRPQTEIRWPGRQGARRRGRTRRRSHCGYERARRGQKTSGVTRPSDSRRPARIFHRNLRGPRRSTQSRGRRLGSLSRYLWHREIISPGDYRRGQPSPRSTDRARCHLRSREPRPAQLSAFKFNRNHRRNVWQRQQSQWEP